MNLRQSLANAIRVVRKNKGLTQEDFGIVSSRTYLSSLERGLKSPTIEKLEQISGVLDVRPATLILLACAIQLQPSERHEFVDEVAAQAKKLLIEVS